MNNCTLRVNVNLKIRRSSFINKDTVDDHVINSLQPLVVIVQDFPLSNPKLNQLHFFPLVFAIS